MGGLGPGIGGTELLVIGLVALLVVGPKDLPVLMRKLGKLMARARGMANEFRASFDEMARQSELDELRKEVESLRSHQGIHALGADADAAFREIGKDLDSGLAPGPVPAMTPAPDEWPDAGPEMTPLAAPVTPELKPEPTVKAKPAAKPQPRPRAKAKPAAASVRKADGKSQTIRAKKVDL